MKLDGRWRKTRLWCFVTSTLCYHVITKSRASSVVKQVLGRVFQGILICDFWGADNKIRALAKQRCLYHLFTELVKVDQPNPSLGWKAGQKPGCPKTDQTIEAASQRTLHLFGILGSQSLQSSSRAEDANPGIDPKGLPAKPLKGWSKNPSHPDDLVPIRSIASS